MILRVIERRAGDGPPPPADRLADLVAPLGRPEWVLDLVLLDDAAMARINVDHYGGEGVTDVLSFTYLEPASAGAADLATGQGGAAMDLRLNEPAPADEAPLAGEILLAPGFIGERCRCEGWDEAAEWAMLVAHGALHVLGWTHDDDRSRAAMRAREAAELARVGWRHPLAGAETER